MPSIDRKSISAAKLKLGNQYAFIEQIEELESAIAIPMPASLNQLHASRRILEDPYAYLSGDGDLEGTLMFHATTRIEEWDTNGIEAKVRDLHRRVWRERSCLHKGEVPSDPVDLLDPEDCLSLIGYSVEHESGLGQIRNGSSAIEVAGMIDTCSKTVRVSGQFPGFVQRYTLAHELGHAVLHPDLGRLHRDRPLDGSSVAASAVESQANKFASLYLMPERLIRRRFEQTFLAGRFAITDESVFALLGISLTDFRRKQYSARSVSRLLAGAERFNGRQVVPLHQQFSVSREAMAIRLEELGLAAS